MITYTPPIQKRRSAQARDRDQSCQTDEWEVQKSSASTSSTGRIVYQDLTRINKAIADGQLKANKVLQEAFSKLAGTGCVFSASCLTVVLAASSITSLPW